MPMTKQGKTQLKTQLAEKLSKANTVVLTEYRGLTVEQLSVLRNNLRESGAEYKIAKNRVFKLATGESEQFKALSDELIGPIGTVFVYGDSAQAAKVLVEFEKEHNNLNIKSGVMDGDAIGIDDLKAISNLPSKEVLLGQIVGSLVAPHRGILGVLSGNARELLQVLNAIKDTKQ